MRNMVLSIGLAALTVGVEANEPARQAAALVLTVNGVSGCHLWGCGMNSPVVEGAVIVPARRHQSAQIASADVVLDEGGTDARQSRIRDSRNTRSAMPSQSKVVVLPLQKQRFGEAWGQNLNSPVIDGAAIL